MYVKVRQFALSAGSWLRLWQVRGVDSYAWLPISSFFAPFGECASDQRGLHSPKGGSSIGRVFLLPHGL